MDSISCWQYGFDVSTSMKSIKDNISACNYKISSQ